MKPRTLALVGIGAVGVGLVVLAGDDDVVEAIDQARPVSGPMFSAFRTPSRPRHMGVDLEGADGELVLATWSGVVQFVQTVEQWSRREPGPGRDAGAYVEVFHDLADLAPDARARIGRLAPDAVGVVTRYMHLGSTAVTRGQRVAAGESVGFLGRTGVNRSRTHLHFEVRLAEPPRRYGEAIDPMLTGVV